MEQNTNYTPSIDCAGLDIPIYPNMANFGFDGFVPLSSRIDLLPKKDQEWTKIPLLLASTDYVSFIQTISSASYAEILAALTTFLKDQTFKEQFSDRLETLDSFQHPGDLRFHGISLYLLVRLLKPRIVVETGIAHGKSSAMMLLGLEHNDSGTLFSIDLPARGLNIDGSNTSLYGHEVGWIVPDYLRKRWNPELGDSKVLLPLLIENEPIASLGIDMFIHDSLHTLEHTEIELSSVHPYLNDKSIVCVDNIDMGSGLAFQRYLQRNSLVAGAFRDFAATRVEISQTEST